MNILDFVYVSLKHLEVRKKNRDRFFFYVEMKDILCFSKTFINSF